MLLRPCAPAPAMLQMRFDRFVVACCELRDHLFRERGLFLWNELVEHGFLVAGSQHERKEGNQQSMHEEIGVVGA